MKRNILAVATLMTLTSSAALAADASRAPFGQLPDGTAVEAVTLTNAHGMSARVMTYGATLQSLVAPDREGKSADVVLGYDTAAPYVTAPSYFGTTIGRYGNRIAGGKFSLDGVAYTLAKNNGENSLHGGNKGFDKVLWRIKKVHSGKTPAVTLEYVSKDGEEGYPGTLKVEVTYGLGEANDLSITYEATTDKPTVVNLTNHSFFNLRGATAGHSVLGNRLMIAADKYTPVDAGLIPTGELRAVAGTPFDFRELAEVGARIRDASDQQMVFGRGYDHNFVLREGVTAEPKLAARVEEPVSGRVMELWTTEPAVQFYSGNFISGLIAGKSNTLYRQGDALCLEPQHYPDSPNQPAFPSTRLDLGQTYRQVSIFRFSTIRK